MKENEVRERVQAFLKNTVRLVVVPASMGIGLALIGCSDSAEDTRQDAGADVVAMAGQSGQSGAGGVSASGGAGGSSGFGGAGGSATLYSAPIYDAGAGGSGGSLASIHPAYMAVLPDAGVSSGGMKYAAPMSSAGSSSSSGGAGGSVTLYAAPVYDAGAGGSGGLASIHPAYMAVLPDAGVSSGGMVGKYAAPMSSGGSVSSGGAKGDGGPGFDAGTPEVQTGGTTVPVTRYGGIFPGSSSSS